MMASPENTPGHRALAKLGVDPELIDGAVADLEAKHSIRGPGWWIRAASNGTLADAVRAVLNERRGEASKPVLALSHEAHRLAVSADPECPHGDPGGDTPHPEDGWLPCFQCRKATRPEAPELTNRKAS